jgi:hypothetical protein
VPWLIPAQAQLHYPVREQLHFPVQLVRKLLHAQQAFPVRVRQELPWLQVLQARVQEQMPALIPAQRQVRIQEQMPELQPAQQHLQGRTQRRMPELQPAQ